MTFSPTEVACLLPEKSTLSINMANWTTTPRSAALLIHDMQNFF